MMKQATFKGWTLTSLEKAFGIKQVWHSTLMESWQKMEAEITEVDKQILLYLQKSLVRGRRSWNETELENKFISPLMMQAHIDDEEISYFLERNLSAVVGDYQLSGIVDGMIATGFREPDVPMFCMHEYKRNMENQGSPDSQVLAAMLVAKEMNQNNHPVYGMFVIGLAWNFIILKDNEYYISNNYVADGEKIYDIFKMLKSLKQIIKTELAI